MIDRWRIAWHQPLSVRARRWLFAVAVAVIVAAAVGLASVDDPGGSSNAPSPMGRSEPPGSSPAVERSVAERPSEEGRASEAAVGSPADVRRVRHAARRFLVAYLPYTYARRDARSIPAATRRLCELLAEERPHVPAGERRRRPRIELIHGDGVGVRRAGVIALIKAGARRYTVSLELERSRRGWLVSSVGS